MRFLIAGASGFLGTALRDRLARDGHQVVRLVRGEPVSAEESGWDPRSGAIDARVVEDADVVVNLAGASFVHWPFTAGYQEEFRQSRIGTTRLLAETIAGSTRRPAFLAQNGTSYYGDRGEEVLTEDSPEGDDGAFLNALTKPWQAAADPAVEAGARVCVLRTGAVLHRRGGAFAPLQRIFRLGLGGPAGDGRQYFPTISLADWVRAVVFLGTHDECSGTYNLTGPAPSTNAEFTRELGRMLHRPTLLRVPEAPVRAIVPQLAPELFNSVRAEPRRLQDAGFEFEHPTVNARIAAALSD